MPLPATVRHVGMLVVAGIAVFGAQPFAAAQESAIVNAYEAYAAGRYDVLTRSFPTAQAFVDARSDLQRTLQAWVQSWRPSYGAFLLELSLVAYDRDWEDAPELLAGTRAMVTGRPDAPGVNAEADAFEIAFHRAAITFFLSRMRLADADAYLNSLAGRVDLTPAIAGAPRLVDPWVAFARAMLVDTQTAPSFREGPRTNADEWDLAIPADDTTMTRLAEQAVAEYERLRPFPALAAEAAARRALLLTRLDRPDEALAALDESDAADADETVRYLSALIRGRTLESLARTTEAAAAYERAAAIVPTAQTPAVALASLWQRADRPDDARQWAERAMTTPAGTIDPWWWYWRGDLRHAAARLDALRNIRP